jgi:hypothetical protein
MDSVYYITVYDIPDYAQKYYPDTDPAAVVIKGKEQKVVYYIPTDQVKTEGSGFYRFKIDRSPEIAQMPADGDW